MGTKTKTMKQPKKVKKQKELTSATADCHRLYEIAVQNTETSIEIIDTIFESQHNKPALSLREDFCGTAKLAADWVGSDKRRTAVGLDVDAPTLAWAKKHNIDPLGDDARRVKLLKKDVLLGSRQRFDVVAAFNFSYWVFKKRDVLKKYFSKVRDSLKPGGVMIIDLHGGPDAQFILEESTEHDGFTFLWEQEIFDPINNHTICHIHFQFQNGSEKRRAFTYDWRLWSLPELRDLLKEAGFKQVDTWWDDENDNLVRIKSTWNPVSWIAYLASWR